MADLQRPRTNSASSSSIGSGSGRGTPGSSGPGAGPGAGAGEAAAAAVGSFVQSPTAGSNEPQQAAVEMQDVLYASFKETLDRLIDEATLVKTIDEGNAELTALTDALERIMQHGFKGKKQWLIGRPTSDVWHFIESTLKGSAAATSAAGAASLLSTVATMTESATHTRIKKYILMALMQQTLGDHIKTMSEAADLLQWYEPYAMIATPDKITPVIGMLQGLTQLEFNLYLKEDEPLAKPVMQKRQSVSQIIMGKGEEALKTGIAATWTTFGRMQSRVEAARGLVMEPFKASDTPPKSAELAAAEESVSKLIADQHDLTQRLEEMQESLNTERRNRLAIEVELVSVKMARDKELTRLRREISRLETQLSVFRVAPSDVQQQLIKSIEDQNDLRQQLDRARLVARVAKEQLDKRNNEVDSAAASPDSVAAVGSMKGGIV
ncbi:hypothetical protein BC831DRAFT_453710 [Entophlyctis helioformis]|nr:hypothetical protein BC831DRAFT_453710 [Entophlyctis helioformis]